MTYGTIEFQWLEVYKLSKKLIFHKPIKEEKEINSKLKHYLLF